MRCNEKTVAQDASADVRSSKQLGVYTESHTDTVTQIKFNPLRQTELLTASLDGLVCFFDIRRQVCNEGLRSMQIVFKSLRISSHLFSHRGRMKRCNQC